MFWVDRNGKIKDMGMRKGQTPTNFFEFQRKGWAANKGRKTWNAGKKGVYSKETLQKMSQRKKENPPNYWKGKHHSEETKLKISIKKKGIHCSPSTEFKKGSQALEKHHQWKGGISKNPKYNTFMSIRRRVRKKDNGGTHTFQQWEELKKKYNYMCLCCKRHEPEIKLTEDHIVPLKNGGSDSIDNLQPLCLVCNSRKSTKIISYILSPI
jgi:hypothetical protein